MILNTLREALQLLELASDVQTRKLNESQIEVRVPRTLKGDSKDLVNVADVGFGVPNSSAASRAYACTS